MEVGKKQKGNRKDRPLSASFKTGAIALVFLLIGYETALFVHRAAQLRLAANAATPDTVYVYAGDRAPDGSSGSETAGDTLAPSGLGMTEGPWWKGLSKGDVIARSTHGQGYPQSSRGQGHSLSSRGQRSPQSSRGQGHSLSSRGPKGPRGSHSAARRPVESFRFNPNTVSLEDLRRLGFSEGQAEAIVHYREKGGRFRRPSDFAKSYVVADSVFRRLEPFIDIPKVDINRADSTLFETLPGIGPWYAGKMVSYRAALRGYSCPEQLMEIYRFDAEKYDGLRDLISCSAPEPFPIWTLPAEELETHPHISRREAAAIVLYRTHQPRSAWTLEGLLRAGILSEDHAAGLSRCLLAAPPTD